METILIADDHEIIRRGIRMIIETLPGQYDIVEASSCGGVIEALSRQKIQYSILDMVFADGNLFSDTGLLADHGDTTGILVFSMNGESIYGKRLLQKGIKGFVSKKSGIDELEKAICSLVEGRRYISPSLQESLLVPSKAKYSENPIHSLSDRELEVVEYTTLGMAVKEIARKMDLDITTVSTYRRRALKKLDVQNMFELKDKFLFYKM